MFKFRYLTLLEMCSCSTCARYNMRFGDKSIFMFIREIINPSLTHSYISYLIRILNSLVSFKLFLSDLIFDIIKKKHLNRFIASNRIEKATHSRTAFLN